MCDYLTSGTRGCFYDKKRPGVEFFYNRHFAGLTNYIIRNCFKYGNITSSTTSFSSSASPFSHFFCSPGILLSCHDDTSQDLQSQPFRSSLMQGNQGRWHSHHYQEPLAVLQYYASIFSYAEEDMPLCLPMGKIFWTPDFEL